MSGACAECGSVRFLVRSAARVECAQCGHVARQAGACVRRSVAAPRKRPLPTAEEVLADACAVVCVNVVCAHCGAKGAALDRVDDVSLARRYTCRACEAQWRDGVDGK